MIFWRVRIFWIFLYFVPADGLFIWEHPTYLLFRTIPISFTNWLFFRFFWTNLFIIHENWSMRFSLTQSHINCFPRRSLFISSGLLFFYCFGRIRSFANISWFWRICGREGLRWDNREQFVTSEILERYYGRWDREGIILDYNILFPGPSLG